MADWKKTDDLVDEMVEAFADSAVADITDPIKKAGYREMAATAYRERLETDLKGLIGNGRDIEAEMAVATERLNDPNMAALLEAADGDADLAKQVASYLTNEKRVEALWQERLAALDPETQAKLAETEEMTADLEAYNEQLAILAHRTEREDAVREAGALLGMNEGGIEDAVLRAAKTKIAPADVGKWIETTARHAKHWFEPSTGTTAPARAGSTKHVAVKKSELADPVNGHQIWKQRSAEAKAANVELQYTDD